MYSDVNRYFIQRILSVGCMTFEETDKFIETFVGLTNELQKPAELIISEINEQIMGTGFRIDTRMCEISGKKTCCIINANNDVISRLPGGYTSADQELFEQILKEIMLSDAKYIMGINCLNLTSRIKTTLSKDAAQKKVNDLCQVGYLVNEKGMIFLGPRTIAEFDHYFKITYKNRLTKCNLCTDDVYYGQICSKCNEVVHNHCLSRYKHRGKKCPICKEAWIAAESRTYADTEGSEEEQETEHEVKMVSEVNESVTTDDEGPSQKRRSKRRK